MEEQGKTTVMRVVGGVADEVDEDDEQCLVMNFMDFFSFEFRLKVS